MGLIKCHECGKEISSQADKCPHCGAMGKSQALIYGWAFVILALILLYAFGGNVLDRLLSTPTVTVSRDSSDHPPKKPSSESKASEWIPAAAHVWKGVKLYYGKGADKTYMGEVVDWDENYQVPYTNEKIRAVLVRMNNGALEWKDRKKVIWACFIKSNDPALP